MTPLEILYEWSKGCSNTQWEKDMTACDYCAHIALGYLRKAFNEEAELLCQSEEEKSDSESPSEPLPDAEETQ